ncbi:DUF2007 domain-containing protein [Marivirga sp.]|uniref:putative signal transducing protein n=1 Tax=Marivirga sp. TaxID=2018662 RepID=UPI0025F677E2|nr:DUF2007 domain-containing protein [Marivirga sp.]
MEKNQKDMIKVYTDSEINVEMVRAELAKIGIPSLVKNDFKSGVMAGFGASPNAVELYVNPSDLDEATSLVQDLNKGS